MEIAKLASFQRQQRITLNEFQLEFRPKARELTVGGLIASANDVVPVQILDAWVVSVRILE